MVAFLLKRQTVVVRVSNFPIMLLHNSCMILLFLSIPLPFTVLETSKTTCLMELLVISLLVYSPYTLIFIKCQNLLLAFNSKLRLSKREKRSSLISQIFIAVVLVSFSLLTLLLNLKFRGLKLDVEIDHLNYKRIYRCNTHRHISTQIILIIVLHLLSTIQAYRGRNLPGPFNEAMPIVYSSFTSTVTKHDIFSISISSKRQ